MSKVYVVTIENPIAEEVKARAVYAKKLEALKSFKDLEKALADKKDPLGLIISVNECRPNEDEEFVPVKTLVSAGI